MQNNNMAAAFLMQKLNMFDTELQDVTTRINTVFRILWEKKMITKDDIVASLRKESDMIKKLESKQGQPEFEETDDMVELSADLIIAYLDCDMDRLTDLQKDLTVKMKEIADKYREQLSNKIQVADAGALDKLDQMSEKTKKLII